MLLIPSSFVDTGPSLIQTSAPLASDLRLEVEAFKLIPFMLLVKDEEEDPPTAGEEDMPEALANEDVE